MTHIRPPQDSLNPDSGDGRSERAPDLEELLDRSRESEVDRRVLFDFARSYIRQSIAPRLNRGLAVRVDPSDLAQETILIAHQQFDTYIQTRPIPFLAWLRKLAKQQLIQAHRFHVRSQRRSLTREQRNTPSIDESQFDLLRTLVADVSTPSQAVNHQEELDRLEFALRMIPKKDRELIQMRHLQQMSLDDLTTVLGISKGTLKVRVLRAVLRLKTILKTLDESSSD